MNLGILIEEYNSGFSEMNDGEINYIPSVDMELDSNHCTMESQNSIYSSLRGTIRSSSSKSPFSKTHWWRLFALTTFLCLFCASFVTSFASHKAGHVDSYPRSNDLNVLKSSIFRSTRAIQSPTDTTNTPSRISKQNRTRILQTAAEIGNQVVVANVTRPGRTKKIKTLPNNASTKHPVSLLFEMQYEPHFDTIHCTHNRKKVAVQSFKSTVTITNPRNMTFGPAYGTSRREAKRRAAILCLQRFHPALSYNNTVDLDLNSRKAACGDI